jgi:hypothetical protein
MKYRLKIPLVCLAIMLLFANCKESPPTVLQGKVFDKTTLAPLAGASVEVYEYNPSAVLLTTLTTDATGHFSSEILTAPNYIYRFSVVKSPYEQSESFPIYNDQTNTVDVGLAPPCVYQVTLRNNSGSGYSIGISDCVPVCHASTTAGVDSVINAPFFWKSTYEAKWFTIQGSDTIATHTLPVSFTPFDTTAVLLQY